MSLRSRIAGYPQAAIPAASVFCKRLAYIVFLVGVLGVGSCRAQFAVIKTINVDVNPFGDALSPDGQDVWVANSGKLAANGNQVTLIDVRTLTEDPKKITVQNFPEDIAFSHLNSRAFVTNSSNNSLSVIDMHAKAVTQTVDLSSVLTFPFGVVVAADGRKIYVTTQGGTGQIAVLTNHHTGVGLTGKITIPGGSGRPALVPQGGSPLAEKVLIPSFQSGPVLNVIDPATDTVVKTTTLAGSQAAPQGTVVSPDGKFAYTVLFDEAGTGGVWVVDLTSLTTVTVINTADPGGFGIGITHNGKFVFATNFLKNQFVAIDAATNKVVATVPVGRQPNDIAVSKDDKKAFVTNQNDLTVSVISIP